MSAASRLFAAALLSCGALQAHAGQPVAPGAAAPFIGQTVPHAAGRDFRLVDTAGAPRSLADFHGKVVLLLFGFTSCPDVCPTELSRLVQTLHTLGEAAQRVQVLFVTLDPARDSAELVEHYLRSFSPAIIGLRGSEAEIAEAARNFRVFFRRVAGSAPEHYTIEHSAYIHVVDPAGNLRLRLPPSMSPADIAADVRLLLDGR